MSAGNPQKTVEALYVYFRNYYAEWFPALREVHSITFTRQMANLWVAKERLWQYLLLRMSFDSQISLVDYVPVRSGPPLQAIARGVGFRLKSSSLKGSE